MNRKEFLALLGVGAAALIADGFLTACNSNNNVTNPTTVDFTLNLTDSNYSALQSNGGYTYYDNVIVARTMSGTYIAVSAVCTHQGSLVAFMPGSTSFHCPSHGSNFTSAGAVSTGPAASPLQQFKTSLNGSLLRVYS